MCPPPRSRSRSRSRLDIGSREHGIPTLPLPIVRRGSILSRLPPPPPPRTTVLPPERRQRGDDLLLRALRDTGDHYPITRIRELQGIGRGGENRRRYILRDDDTLFTHGRHGHTQRRVDIKCVCVGGNKNLRAIQYMLYSRRSVGRWMMCGSIDPNGAKLSSRPHSLSLSARSENARAVTFRSCSLFLILSSLFLVLSLFSTVRFWQSIREGGFRRRYSTKNRKAGTTYHSPGRDGSRWHTPPVSRVSFAVVPIMYIYMHDRYEGEVKVSPRPSQRDACRESNPPPPPCLHSHSPDI